MIDIIDNEHHSNAIINLEKSQYSADSQNWHGKSLSSAIKHFIKQNKIQKGKQHQFVNQAFASLNPVSQD